MADVKPKSTDKAAAKPKKAEKDLTPQELEAKKAADAAKAEDKKQQHIRDLIKSKKYFLPIKK